MASASGSVRVRPTALQKRSGGTPGLVAAAPSRCQTLSGGSCTILALHPSQSCCAWGVAKVARGPGIWEQPGSALPSPAPPHHKPLCGGGVQEAPWRVLWRRPIWSERTRLDSLEQVSAFLLPLRWLETLLYQCSFSAFLLLPHGPPLHWLRLTFERSIESLFFCEMLSHSSIVGSRMIRSSATES